MILNKCVNCFRRLIYIKTGVDHEQLQTDEGPNRNCGCIADSNKFTNFNISVKSTDENKAFK